MALTARAAQRQLTGLAPAFTHELFRAASCAECAVSWYFLCNMCLPHYQTTFPLLQHLQFSTHLINTLNFMGHQCPKSHEHLIFGNPAARFSALQFQA